MPRLRFRLVLSALLLFAISAARAADFDVRAHGAKGDGVTLDTAAINRAIEAAAAAGGGRVVFPAGNYLSFSIRLKSHVELHLGPGCTIIAADPPADLSSGYDAPEPNDANNQYQDFGHTHFRNSLIWGIGLEHIAITGPGRIYGYGLSKELDRRDLTLAERALPPPQRPDVRIPAAMRAHLDATVKAGPFGYPRAKEILPAGIGNKSIALRECRNVTLRDFTVFHGGIYCVLATGCDNVTIDNLTLDSNRCGIDLDCSRNVRVSNCTINMEYDDALVLKSSRALGRLQPLENVTITNCTLSGYDEGSLFDGTRTVKNSVRSDGGRVGRIKFGTESCGGFRNVTITNCTFDYCRGLTVATVDGGAMEDIVISNITMRHISGAPIFIRQGERLRGPRGTTVGGMRRIKISNIIIHDNAASSGILISGTVAHPIEDLSLSNIFLHSAGGGTREQGERTVPEFERAYPTAAYWGTMPAWGLWVRHVRNFSADRIEVRAANEDLRPVAILDRVTEVVLDRVNLPAAANVARLVLLDARDITVSTSPGLPELRRAGPFQHERLD